MTETFTEFDPADYLASPEAIVEFLTDALERRRRLYRQGHRCGRARPRLAVMKALGILTMM